jgi:hypothetical protein
MIYRSSESSCCDSDYNILLPLSHVLTSNFWFYLLLFILLIIIMSINLIITNFNHLWIGISLYCILIVGCIFFAYSVSRIEFNSVIAIIFAAILILTAIASYSNMTSDGKIATLILLLIVIVLVITTMSITRDFWPIIFLIWVTLFYFCKSLDL